MDSQNSVELGLSLKPMREAVFGARYLRARDTVLDLAADVGALQEFTAKLK